MSIYARLEDGTLVPCTPEPFWERSWRTLFRWRPMCCNKIHKDRAAYEAHYVACHETEPAPEEAP